MSTEVQQEIINKIPAILFLGLVIGPLLYGLYLEIKREREEKK